MLLTRHSTAEPQDAAGATGRGGTAQGRAGTGPAEHRFNADDATAIALFNCLVREVGSPEHQVRTSGRHLVVRLARAGVTLRARLARPPAGPSFRLLPPIEEERPPNGTAGAASVPGGVDGGAGANHSPGPARWTPVDWSRLADLVAGELELASGVVNPEFLRQVADSHAAMSAMSASSAPVAARPAAEPATARPAAGPAGGPTAGAPITGAAALPGRPAVDQAAFIAAEQALVAGHRFHPSPKARQGEPRVWLPYAPEAGARFRLRWLAVATESAAAEGDPLAWEALDALGPQVPEGYRALPAHPWQLSLIGDRPALRDALSDGRVLDLGPVGPEAAPTSSVRTLYVPAADVFAKFSLDVRITNCVRKNSWYELTGAVLLNRLLEPVFTDLGALFDGCALLPEPAYRTAALPDRHVHDGLSVIVRGGVTGCRATPLPAAALADPYGHSAAAVVRLLADAPEDLAMAWWDAYVRLVVPPVLHAYLVHGVVLEPHLQNVLVSVGPDRMPEQAIFRDLEGTKLVGEIWGARTGPAGAALAAAPARVREALTYDAERGWNRVVYCLFVNHLAEICAAVGDLHPGLEQALWRRARERIVRYALEHSAAHDRHPAVGGRARLQALLSGVPLPAKANLRARWRRSADRVAGYVQVPNPLGDR